MPIQKTETATETKSKKNTDGFSISYKAQKISLLEKTLVFSAITVTTSLCLIYVLPPLLAGIIAFSIAVISFKFCYMAYRESAITQENKSTIGPAEEKQEEDTSQSISPESIDKAIDNLSKNPSHPALKKVSVIEKTSSQSSVLRSSLSAFSALFTKGSPDQTKSSLDKTKGSPDQTKISLDKTKYSTDQETETLSTQASETAIQFNEHIDEKPYWLDDEKTFKKPQSGPSAHGKDRSATKQKSSSTIKNPTACPGDPSLFSAFCALFSPSKNHTRNPSPQQDSVIVSKVQ